MLGGTLRSGWVPEYGGVEDPRGEGGRRDRTAEGRPRLEGYAKTRVEGGGGYNSRDLHVSFLFPGVVALFFCTGETLLGTIYLSMLFNTR